jgi:elongation factor P hydroxylase
MIAMFLTKTHQIQDLIRIFNHCFLAEYNTELVRGGEEPIYLPAGPERKHCQLIFAHGFFASGLHETAHWLIAGEERRKLVDFGYWYEPDGRTAAQQQVFQSVEVKPQAMEWILSKAANFRFRVSLDNLNGPQSETDAFKQNVYAQVKRYCENPLPKRAQLIRNALCEFYGTASALNFDEFDIADI